MTSKGRTVNSVFFSILMVVAGLPAITTAASAYTAQERARIRYCERANEFFREEGIFRVYSAGPRHRTLVLKISDSLSPLEKAMAPMTGKGMYSDWARLGGETICDPECGPVGDPINYDPERGAEIAERSAKGARAAQVDAETEQARLVREENARVAAAAATRLEEENRAAAARVEIQELEQKVGRLEATKQSPIVNTLLDAVVPGLPQVVRQGRWEALWFTAIIGGTVAGAVMTHKQWEADSASYEKDWKNRPLSAQTPPKNDAGTYFALAGLFYGWSLYDAWSATADKNEITDISIQKHREKILELGPLLRGESGIPSFALAAEIVF